MPTILLVEDDQPNRDILARRLRRNGYTILTAATALDACTIARDNRPDLVLMDIGLPGVDGWEATRRLRADQATQALPIIALTGFVMADEREKAIAAGCDEFHGKPVEFIRLLSQIRTLLQRDNPS